MRFFKGAARPEQDPALIGGGHLPAQASGEFSGSQVSPLEFAVQNEEDLAASAQHWRTALKTVDNTVNDPDNLVAIGGAYDEVSRSAGVEPIEGPARDRSIREYKDDFAKFLVVTARYAATTTPLDQSTLGYVKGNATTFKKIFNSAINQNYSIGSILSRSRVAKAKFGMCFSSTAGEIAAADDASTRVLNNLSDNARKDPSFVSRLAELFENNVADIDPRFAELKKMIVTDWHRPDTENSILKGLFADVRDNPESSVFSFADRVAEPSQDKKAQLINTMARFALAAKGIDIKSSDDETAAIRKVLIDSFDSWGEFPELSDVFNRHHKQKMTELEQDFILVAGAHDVNSARSHRTQGFVDKLIKSVGFIVPEERDRQSRRGAERRRGKALGKIGLKEPFTDKTNGENETARLDKVLIARRGESKTIFEEVHPEDVAAELKIKGNQQINKDATSIIDYLLENPIHDGAEVLKSRKVKIVKPGNGKLGIWKASPYKMKGLTVHQDHRHLEIIYGVDPGSGSLVVVDIVDHNEFDRKYK